MADTWANFGIALDRAPAGRQVRAGLERSLREAIQTGQLRPGTRLPSSRALALDLGIARNTVADAYGQLVAEGWLAARQGSGTSVADHAATPGAAPAPAAEAGRVRYDLRPGRPDLALFPRAAWLAAARRALTAAPYEVLGYGDPRGLVQLRQALAGYLARIRGVRVTPDRIVVCSGFVQALGLLCRVQRERGAGTLAVEAYGHLLHRDVATSAGLRVVPIAVDAAGAAVDEVAGAGMLLLTPAHQFPLGVPLAPERRRRAVEWARDAGGLIIEDDYDGEFRYDRQAVGAMQALAPEHIVYAGTASKSLAPGLRLGWAVVPAHLVDQAVEAKRLADVQAGALDQLTLAELVVSGAYDRHVRRCRLAYQRRRERLVATLRRRVPDAHVAGVAAGLQALVVLPDGQHEDDALARAADRGLAVESPSTAASRSRGSRASAWVRTSTPRRSWSDTRRRRSTRSRPLLPGFAPSSSRPADPGAAPPNVSRFTQRARRPMQTACERRHSLEASDSLFEQGARS